MTDAEHKAQLADLLAKKRALQKEFEDICQRMRTNDWELKQLEKGVKPEERERMRKEG